MHDHSHPAPNRLNAAFKWAVALNAGYIVLEVAAGLWASSLALLADAAHNLTDVAGLLLAWGASLAAQKHPTLRHTYGYGRTTILAALMNASAILGGVVWVVWEAANRFSAPREIATGTVAVTALLGIAVNAGTALLFRKERHADLNAHGAFLHMMTDAAVSLGVVLSALLVAATGFEWIDPAVAIGVSLMVALSSYSLFKASLALSLDGVPSSVDLEKVRGWLLQQDGVLSVHDLHVWALSTTENALTAHLVMPEGGNDVFLDRTAYSLREHFGIGHVTLQIERNKKSCHQNCACE
jgi:cobalt-zinc-cadmium efflux system protein